MTHLDIEPGSLQSYTRHTTTTATICYNLPCEKCSIYNQCVWAAVLQEFWLKFRQESSTPWHSKRRRWRTTELRTILKKSPCSPRIGASYRASLVSIRGETTELRACQKKCGQTDRQTAFRLYIVDTFVLA